MKGKMKKEKKIILIVALLIAIVAGAFAIYKVTSDKKSEEIQKETDKKNEEVKNSKESIKESEFLKIDKDLYGKYERQNVIIPIKHLLSVCEYFNSSIDYIFSFNDLKYYKDSTTINIELMSKRLKEIRKEIDELLK